MIIKNRTALKILGTCLTCATLILESHGVDEIQRIANKLSVNRLVKDDIHRNIGDIIEKVDACSIAEVIGMSKLKQLGGELGKAVLKEEKLTEKLEKIYRNEYGYNVVGVALFSGADGVSNVIKGLTNSNTSHVGIILSDPKDENKWYCFESTGTVSEAMSGIYPHVRLTDWNEVVGDYEGHISYRLCVFENMERPNPIKIGNFVEKYDGKSYTKNFSILLNALFNTNASSSKKPGTVFCSELVARMFMKLGILQPGIERNCLPSDFEMKNLNPRVSVNDGVDFTPEYVVK